MIYRGFCSREPCCEHLTRQIYKPVRYLSDGCSEVLPIDCADDTFCSRESAGQHLTGHVHEGRARGGYIFAQGNPVNFSNLLLAVAEDACKYVFTVRAKDFRKCIPDVRCNLADGSYNGSKTAKNGPAKRGPVYVTVHNGRNSAADQFSQFCSECSEGANDASDQRGSDFNPVDLCQRFQQTDAEVNQTGHHLRQVLSESHQAVSEPSDQFFSDISKASKQLIKRCADVSALEQGCHEVLGAFLQLVHARAEGVRHCFVCFANDVCRRVHFFQVAVELIDVRRDQHRSVTGFDGSPQINHAQAGFVCVRLHKAEHVTKVRAGRHGFLEAHPCELSSLCSLPECLICFCSRLTEFSHRRAELCGCLCGRNAGCRQLGHCRANLVEAHAHCCSCWCHLSKTLTEFTNRRDTKVLCLHQDALDILCRTGRLTVGVHCLRGCAQSCVKVCKTCLRQCCRMFQHIEQVFLGNARRFCGVSSFRQLGRADSVGARQSKDVIAQLCEFLFCAGKQRIDLCHAGFELGCISDALHQQFPDSEAYDCLFQYRSER